MINLDPQAIALGARLKKCRNVRTFGVRPNLGDYTSSELNAIERAPVIYYPSRFYADLFAGINKPTFPNAHTYAFAQDKILQTALFLLNDLPHPKTRVFYGPRQKKTVTDHFRFPLIAKIPRHSSMGEGVFLIRNHEELEAYLRRPNPAYIQTYLPGGRHIRVVVIGYRIVLAYWRLIPPDEFRSNLARGASISPDRVPREYLELARQAARKCRFNDVGFDILVSENAPYILEANMRYGRKGFEQAGIDYSEMMAAMIANGWI